MGVLVVEKTYADGQILGEENLDNAFESIQDFVNNANISSENIQDNSITAAEIQVGSVDSSKIVAQAVTTTKLQDSSVTMAKLAADVQNLLSPVGRITAFAGDTAPTGWMLCDGTAISRTTYPQLFSLVGIRFGNGDTTTTFNIPDLRGRFLRGRNGGTGRDPDVASRTAMNTGGATGDAVGSVQQDDWKWTQARVSNSASLSVGSGNVAFSSDTGVPTGQISIGINQDGITTKTGLETRPKNANVNFIIKVG